MNKTLRRLLLAASVSATSFAGTFYWYHSTKPQFQVATESGIEVARIISSRNEVNKRPLRRLVWRSLGAGDVLFDGETIKTAENSEAKIQFSDSNSTLDIEPNSLIVLETKDNQISLDLLEGGLFVSSAKKDSTQKGPAITLKTDKGKVELTNAEASLSKTKGKTVDLQVLKGQAKVEVNGKKTTIEKGKSGKLDGEEVKVIKSNIEILSPEPFETVYINPEKPRPVSFKFTPLPEADKVYIEIGNSRKEMKRVEGAVANAKKGQLRAPIAVGRYFYKLVAEDQDGKLNAESPVYRIPIEALMPPSPISPVAEEVIQTENLPYMAAFQWSGSESYDTVLFQISTQPNFKKLIHKERSTSGFSEVAIDQPGEYHWRLVGFKNKKPNVSETQKFRITQLAPVDPPALLEPQNLSKLAKDQLPSGAVRMSWKPVEGALGYELKLNVTTSSGKFATKTFQTKKTYLKVPKPPVGSFEWSVSTVSPDKRRSIPSESFTFEVKGYPPLAWVDRSKPDILEFVTAKPTAPLKWEKGPEETRQYRLRLGDSRDKLKSSRGRILREQEIVQEFPKTGRYFAVVEALDEKGQLITRSKVRTFKVTEKPLLAAPAVAPESDGVLKASKRGNYQLVWDPVEGAREYLVEIVSDRSKKLKTYKYEEASADFKSLLPGSYQLRVQAVDSAGRRGPASEPRQLDVPKKSEIKAPVLKKIEVK